MFAVSPLGPRWHRWLLVALVVCLLQGCKDNLYSNLSEQDANQMLALLLNHGVDAEKQGSSSDTISLKVEKAQFAYAVELLKQNGYPRQQFSTVEDLFPQDGLVATQLRKRHVLFMRCRRRWQKL